jgi:hypothetical protein
VSQGDQIGRIFAYWAIFKFGLWFKNYRISKTFSAIFFHGTSCVLIVTKNGWATFWPTFSQTQLVTLLVTLCNL